ncbi:hypothetical protein Dda_4852 [Drechslerella dactyloides]|uniref:Uncharacterized protein n=1 Tax=Drechslerella dactyloides TaxID=74499 RepID=A0AAD6J1Y3_DREDA|nr:hypothetical protein Dda_4852 [Drechslerella dactyloides]
MARGWTREGGGGGGGGGVNVGGEEEVEEDDWARSRQNQNNGPKHAKAARHHQPDSSKKISPRRKPCFRDAAAMQGSCSLFCPNISECTMRLRIARHVVVELSRPDAGS